MSDKPRRDQRQIAQDALDLTLRNLERNRAAVKNLREQLERAERLGRELERLAEHQRSHPALDATA